MHPGTSTARVYGTSLRYCYTQRRTVLVFVTRDDTYPARMSFLRRAIVITIHDGPNNNVPGFLRCIHTTFGSDYSCAFPV